MLLRINVNSRMVLNIKNFIFGCSGALRGAVIYSEVPKMFLAVEFKQ